MQKLTADEIRACQFLSRQRDGAFCPGEDFGSTPEGEIVIAILDQLVRKKRAVRTASDDGAVYRLTDLGWSEAG